ncbi:hypothetical protein ABCV69_004542 [Pseudomonas aeruginosa]|uniref:hypothetical protein n=1 Tax=Pseudomonas aeruginosa TaxID=287 RepID=UPI0005B4F856|nr:MULTISPECIES: hypothetical protein [Pseudomonadaceae]EKY4114756.1 hypothetical protein [Pseudomonas aeruginosa]ELJ2278676.1 hypothetical protein [Pseudomonas aeruginosa]KJS79011.1 MAG: type IV secretion protein IcmG [[Pseudomonas] sp. BICA1-14]MBS2052367.1 type IV secretion protein IcmG [Pseudomonas aeruginosa]HBP0221248.1 type IV secretion protein IcmG [Pseudomonas aeruginosa]
MSIDQEDILGQQNEFEDEDTPPAGKKMANKNGQLMTYGAYAVAVIVVGFAMFKIFGPRFLHSDNQGYSAASIGIEQPVGQGAGQYGYQGQGYQPQLQPTTPVSTPTGQYQQAQSYPADPQVQAQMPSPPVVQQSVPPVEQVAPVQPQVNLEHQAEAVAPLPTSGQEAASIAQVQKQLEQQDIQLKAIQETLDEIKKSLSTTASKPAPKASVASKPSTSQAAPPRKPQQQAQRQAQKPQAGSGQQKNSLASLSLKAVLDGRAWFVTKGGESISVSVGDTIPGVGSVQRIDPDQGQVIMSNGVVYR